MKMIVIKQQVNGILLALRLIPILSSLFLFPSGTFPLTFTPTTNNTGKHKASNQNHRFRRKNKNYYAKTIEKNSNCNNNSSRSNNLRVSTVGPRVPINEEFRGLRKIYSNPDIFIIENFLDSSHCQNLIDEALEKKLERSPVAYAGWTEDFKGVIEILSKGPVVWIALLSAWFQIKDGGGNQLDLVYLSLQNYAITFAGVTFLVGLYTYLRTEGLKSLRTSTSTTIDDLSNPSSGARTFVRRAAELFGTDTSNNDGDLRSRSKSSILQQEAALFEAPTVIKYEKDQILAPHYDANPSSDIEDANRGGQTLSTLLVYLNDVEHGGLTRFGKLSTSAATSSLLDYNDGDVMQSKHLVIQPKRGDALLFFPADFNGQFDPRTEHEGMAAVDEKWIARIWKHQRRVPPPFGLSESTLCNYID